LNTREWAAWLVLCCASPFAFANAPSLSIETALPHPSQEASAQPTDTDLDQVSPEGVLDGGSAFDEHAQVLWPMMPKESLAKLAKSFYPNSPILAQRFIQKSVRLSRALGVNIDPNAAFKHAQIIAIPNEKEVRALTHRIKKSDEVSMADEQLKLSYELKAIIPPPIKPSKATEHHAKAMVSTGPVGLALPEVAWPTVSWPMLQLPTQEALNTKMQHSWRAAQMQMADMWLSTKETVLVWNGNLLNTMATWQSQGLRTLQQNKALNIAVVMGLLLLLGLLVWVWQRHYLRRKITLLTTSQTTLMEPTIGDLKWLADADAENDQQATFHLQNQSQDAMQALGADIEVEQGKVEQANHIAHEQTNDR
jgi:hypothetical protein